MTKKLKSGTPFVYDENDRVVGIRDPHTGTDTDLVTATRGPGGVVRNSLGELVWRPGWNQLVRQHPQLVAHTVNRDGVTQYTSAAFTGGGSAAVAFGATDPATGLPMLQLNMPAGGAGQWQSVTWEDIEPVQMTPRDAWIVTVFVPLDVKDARVELTMSPDQTVGSNWRRFSWRGAQLARLARGWNVLICLNEETEVNGTTYDTLGTTPYPVYEISGTVSPEMAVRSISVRAMKWYAPVEEISIYVGSVHIAREGWCTAAMMWGADDVPQSFIDRALPIIESYGWRATFNSTSAMRSTVTTHASIEALRGLSARGHEIWAHTRAHENMVEAVDKAPALNSAANFFRANGLPSAAHYMAWPFGAYNADAILAAKAAGYKIARAIDGSSTPWLAALNPYAYPAFSPELENPWQTDAAINGMVLRGQSMFTYMHNTIAGGAGINAYPGASQHYEDHLRRWCELVASHEDAGRCAVLTGTEYFHACGIDPVTMPFYEPI